MLVFIDWITKKSNASLNKCKELFSPFFVNFQKFLFLCSYIVITEITPEMQHAMEGTLIIEEGDGTTITVTQASEDENDSRTVSMGFALSLFRSLFLLHN